MNNNYAIIMASNNQQPMMVHDLTSTYIDTMTSVLEESARRYSRPSTLIDDGNTVPQSPKRRVDSDDEDDDNNSGDNSVVHVKLSIVDPYGDKGEYEGNVLRSSLKNPADGHAIPHGPAGTMKYADGRIYTGHWKEGSWDGQGKTIYPNGDSYEGGYEGDQRHGIGIYKWNDGRFFQGNFRNDQRNGHGVYKWPDGSTYVGGFLEGQRHGEGTYSFRDGSVYTGEWRRGIRHGIGEYHWVDGRIYKGQWVAGKAHGYGIETRSNGSIRHDGQWENDQPI